jgi:hypothetical protein
MRLEKTKFGVKLVPDSLEDSSSYPGPNDLPPDHEDKYPIMNTARDALKESVRSPDSPKDENLLDSIRNKWQQNLQMNRQAEDTDVNAFARMVQAHKEGVPFQRTPEEEAAQTRLAEHAISAIAGVKKPPVPGPEPKKGMIEKLFESQNAPKSTKIAKPESVMPKTSADVPRNAETQAADVMKQYSRIADESASGVNPASELDLGVARQQAMRYIDRANQLAEQLAARKADALKRGRR